MECIFTVDGIDENPENPENTENNENNANNEPNQPPTPEPNPSSSTPPLTTPTPSPSPPPPPPSPPPPPPTPPAPPSDNEHVIGDFAYSTDNILGHSPFAVVYKGRRVSDNKPIAVKIISKNKASSKIGFTKAELDVLEELIGLKHPNIVEIYGYHNDVEKFYVFMEFCNYKDLGRWLSRMCTLSESTIRFYLKQISEGMKILRDKGIIHRNLTPQNLLLITDEDEPSSADMYVKISDFGFARFLGEGDKCSDFCGAAHYMAPEIFLSKRYDEKVDLWSIGAIAYQCFTTHTPVSGPNDKPLNTFFHGLDTCFVGRPYGISDEFWNLIQKLLQPNPNRRMSFDEFHTHPVLVNLSNVPTPRVSAESYRTEYSFGSYSPSKESFLKEKPEGEAAAAAAADPDPDVGSPLGDDDIPHTLSKGDKEDKDDDEEAQGAVGGAPAGTSKEPVDGECGFVVVPPERQHCYTSSGRIIDAVYDPIFDVVLPVVRGETPPPHERRLSRK